MTEPEHLAHAPIVEAALGIATSGTTTDVEKLAGFQSFLGDDYPTKQVAMSWVGQIELRPDALPASKASGTQLGYAFSSRDTRHVVQARRDGFAFSRMPPYETWESFNTEARRLWVHYLSLAKPEKITRIGVRYINKILLPLPINDINEYLLSYPEIAPGLPQVLSNFFYRVVVPVDDQQAQVAITETIAEAEVTQVSLPIILDIDVYRVGTFPVSVDKLWPLFGPLRDLKNRFFFSSITDKTKELLK